MPEHSPPMPMQRIDFLDIPVDTGATPDDLCRLMHAKGAMRLVTFVNQVSQTITTSLMPLMTYCRRRKRRSAAAMSRDSAATAGGAGCG